MAMGGAFVAIADDEEALYINPAGLAGMTGTTFSPLDLSLEGTTQDYTAVKNSLSQLKNITTNTLDILMGQDVYLKAQYTPSLIMQNFGIGFISDQQFRLFTENKALPQVQFGLQSTNGVQLGSPASRGGSTTPPLTSLEPRQSVYATFTYPNSGNICGNAGTPTAGLRVYPPNQTAALFAPFTYASVCSTAPGASSGLIIYPIGVQGES